MTKDDREWYQDWVEDHPAGQDMPFEMEPDDEEEEEAETTATVSLGCATTLIPWHMLIPQIESVVQQVAVTAITRSQVQALRDAADVLEERMGEGC